MVMNLAATAARLKETEDIDEKLKLVCEVRDCIEIAYTNEYTNFLQSFMPVFLEMLNTSLPPQSFDTKVHKLRNTIVEILSRLPMSDTHRQHAMAIHNAIMTVIATDNEENVLSCLRLLLEMHRSYRNSFEKEVSKFFELVMRVFREVPNAVAKAFPPDGQAVTPVVGPDGARYILPGMESFKVLAECPVVVVALLQQYSSSAPYGPQFAKDQIANFVPLLMTTLSMEIPAHGITTNRIGYIEFIGAQAKTMSFVAYMLRMQAEVFRPHFTTIPKSIIYLLTACPGECVAIRRELLIAMRHIQSTECRVGFAPHIDTLLDDRILIGTGRSAMEGLRPLAYGALADLVHQLRQELHPTHIHRLVELFARNMHDMTLPLNIQIMSTKIITGLMETFTQRFRVDPSITFGILVASLFVSLLKGRSLCMFLLESFVNKLSSFRKFMLNFLDKTAQPVDADNKESEDKQGESGPQSNDSIQKECRLLMKYLLMGIKTLVWGVPAMGQTQQPPQQQGGALLRSGFSMSETHVLCKLLKNMYKSFSVHARMNPSGLEEKEILDSFASTFTMVDVRTLQIVFQTHMDLVFEQTKLNQGLLVIPQQLLGTNAVTSKFFLDVLINSFVNKLEWFDSPDKTTGFVLLRVFKLIFGAVTLNLDNEVLFAPHTSNLVTSALKHALESKDPLNYLMLLKGMFQRLKPSDERKFELLHKEFIPLIPDIITSLQKLERGAHKAAINEIITELMISIPARINYLLPFMRHMMRPLVTALKGGPELSLIALRLMENWVDTLTPEMTDFVAVDVQHELMDALFSHLQPATAQSPAVQHARLALELLGKLGGRNRRFLVNPAPVAKNKHRSSAARLRITYAASGTSTAPSTTASTPPVPVLVSLDECISVCQQQLLSATSGTTVKQQSFSLLCATCAVLLHLEQPSAGSMRVVPIASLDVQPEIFSSGQQDAAKSLFCETLTALWVAAADADLKDQAAPFISHIIRHFALLLSAYSIRSSTSDYRSRLPPSVIFDAIVRALTVAEPGVSAAVLSGVEVLVDTLTTLLNDNAYSVLDEFVLLLVQECHHHSSTRQASAASVISTICTKMPDRWLMPRFLLMILRGLIFALRATQIEVSIVAMEQVSSTLNQMYERVFAVAPSSPAIVQEVIAALCPLIHADSFQVRKSVTGFFQQLANVLQVPLTEMLAPFLMDMLDKATATPLSGVLSMERSFGIVHGLLWLIKLLPVGYVFTEQTVARLREISKLASADSPVKPQSQHHLMVIQLRALCIECIVAATRHDLAMERPELADIRATQNHVFVKGLQAPHADIIAATREAFLLGWKPTKDQLRDSLVPALNLLQDHQKLSLSFIEGLYRLVEHMQFAFKSELGNNLLAHLVTWSEVPSGISTAAEQERLKVAAGIVRIFVVLPHATQFLSDLITRIVSLEAGLKPYIVSPYRAALAEVVRKYSTESASVFLEHGSDPAFMELLQSFVKLDSMQLLRTELMAQPHRLVSKFFQPSTIVDEAEIRRLQREGCTLVYLLAKSAPNWLSEQDELRTCLQQVWAVEGKPALQMLDCPVDRRQTAKALLRCFMVHCLSRRPETMMLFEMAWVFSSKHGAEFEFLEHFLVHDVPKQYSLAEKRQVFQAFVESFHQSIFTHEHRVQLLQKVIIPMVQSVLKQGEGAAFMTPDLVTQFVGMLPEGESAEAGLLGGVSGPQHTTGPSVLTGPSSDSVNIELMQLSSLLLSYLHGSPLSAHKLIRFGWLHLKSEDQITKNWAYVFVSKFMEQFTTPEKFILQIYVFLLRAHQIESRQLVRQALDVLIPILPTRIPTTPDQRYPLWIKWTKKIFVEESHAIPQVLHVLHIIVRHETLFYPYRSQFAFPMVNSLMRIGVAPSSSPSSSAETRKLSADVAEVLIQWDKRALSIASSGATDAQAAKRVKSEEDDVVIRPPSFVTPMVSLSDPLPAPSPMQGVVMADQDESFRANAQMVEIILNFLFRMACMSADPRTEPGQAGMSQRCLDLLRESFKTWPSVVMKTTHFERVLPSTLDNPYMLVSALEVLNIMAETQMESFVLPTIGFLTKWFFDTKFVIASDNNTQVNLICSFLTKLLAAYPLGSAPSEVQRFYDKLSDNIEQITRSADSKHPLYGPLMVLRVISATKPEFMDKFLVHIVKSLQKMAKDHTSPAVSATKPSDPASTTATPTGPEQILVSTLGVGLQLVGFRCVVVKEHIKPVTTILNVLLEKSTNVGLLQHVVTVVAEWVLPLQQPSISAPSTASVMPPVSEPLSLGDAMSVELPPPPSMPQLQSLLPNKERFQLVTRLGQLDRLGNLELQKSVLRLAHALFADTTIPRPDLVRIENLFLWGLRSQDAELRAKFLALMDAHVPRTAADRLLYVLGGIQWEAAADHPLTRHFVQILLSAADTQARLASVTSGPRVPALSTNSLPGQVNAPELERLLSNHAEFIQSVFQQTVGDLLQPLIALVHFDSHLAHLLWVALYPPLFRVVSQDEKLQVQKQMGSLLAKDTLTRQASLRPNLIETLLEAACRSEMALPADVLRYAARTFHAWYPVVTLLGRYVSSSSSGSNVDDNARISLQQMYKLLNDEDMEYGLWKQRFQLEETRAGLTLAQMGVWNRVQEVFGALLQKPDISTQSRAEITVWETQWVEAGRQLEQWDVLLECAKSVGDAELQAECMFRSGDWTDLRELVHKNAIPDNVEEGLYNAACLLLGDHKVQETDAALAGLSQNLLKQWRALPYIPCDAHLPLLVMFQRVVEIGDTARIVELLAQHKSNPIAGASQINQVFPILKATLVTWRDRLPNIWDSMTDWSAIISWRFRVFAFLNSVLNPLSETNPSIGLCGHHETAWATNTLARTARKHALIPQCLTLLERIYQLPNIEIADAFVKLKEQVKCYLYIASPQQLKMGLDAISVANLEYFNKPFVAELMALKGDFQHRLGLAGDAHQSFLQSLQLHDGLSLGWYSWAQYCDKASQHQQNVEWVTNAVHCYMMAVYQNTDYAIKCLPRILWLLTSHGDEPGSSVANVFLAKVLELPTWVWLELIPQLLSSVRRHANTPNSQVALCIKKVLFAIAAKYPQALFYHLREAIYRARGRSNEPLLHDSDDSSEGHHVADPMVVDSVRVSAVSPAPPSQLSATDVGSSPSQPVLQPSGPVESLEEVMRHLRTCHRRVYVDTEAFVQQLVSLRPYQVEVLYVLLYDILLVAYDIAHVTSDPSHLLQRLNEVNTVAFMSRWPAEPFASPSSPFTQPRFVADFLTPGSSPATINAIATKLHEWVIQLRNHLARLPKKVGLHSLSPTLLEMRSSAIEIPGQYEGYREPAVGYHSKLHRLSNDVGVEVVSGLCTRRITMRATNGRDHTFMLVFEPLLPTAARSDGMRQVLRSLNAFMQKDIQCRKRRLNFVLPQSIPLAVGVRLVQWSKDYVSLEDVFDDRLTERRFLRMQIQHLQQTSVPTPGSVIKEEGAASQMQQVQQTAQIQQQQKATAGQPHTSLQLMQVFFSKISSAQVSSREQLKVVRRTALQELSNYVGDALWTEYLVTTYPSSTERWIVQRRLMTQIAQHMYTQAVFSLKLPHPRKIIFDKSTGNLVLLDLTPEYAKTGLLRSIASPQAAPFRLSQNIIRILGSQGRLGVLPAVFASLSHCLQETADHIRLMMYEEVHDWNLRFNRTSPLPETKLRELANQNLTGILDLVKQLALPDSPSPVSHLDAKLADLTNLASHPDTLSDMGAALQPWM